MSTKIDCIVEIKETPELEKAVAEELKAKKKQEVAIAILLVEEKKDEVDEDSKRI